VIFIGINMLGTGLTLRLGLVVTLLAVAVLVIFYVSAAFSGAFSWEKVYNIPPQAGQSSFLPFGWFGIFAALPFAIWFYLAIEQLPLAAEESHNAVRDMPKALIWGMGTLLVLSLLTLVFNSGVGGGVLEVGASAAPLEIGFTAIFGQGATKVVLTIAALTGLIASFHTIMVVMVIFFFAYSRNKLVAQAPEEEAALVAAAQAELK